MKQFVVIGLGAFGKRMIEELSAVNVEVLLIEKDEFLTDQYKDKVSACYVADAGNEEVLAKLIPKGVDTAIIDMGSRIEDSVLAANYLKKLGIREIIVRAESDQHGEILKLVGATRIIFPAKEAAQKITPILVSEDLFSYFPIGDGLVIAEIKVPRECYNKTLIEADLRKKNNINIIAVKEQEGSPFQFVGGGFIMSRDNILLAVGMENDLFRLTGKENIPKRSSTGISWLRFLQRSKK